MICLKADIPEELNAIDDECKATQARRFIRIGFRIDKNNHF